MLHANKDVNAEPETKQQLKEWQRVEDTANADGFTSSNTLKEVDVVHIVEDIIQVH